MSQFLSRRLSNLSPGNNALRIRFRLFSSSLPLDTSAEKYFPPYFIFGGKTEYFGKDDDIHIEDFSRGGSRYFKKKVPPELLGGKGIIGASRNWIATQKKGGVICLQDDLNLCASESNPKRISLPPLVTLRDCQTKIVTNMAMSSSSPDQDRDCVVAIKFLGPQLSLIRPARDSKWTNIRITNPSFFTSHVVHSQRNQMFSLPTSGASQIGSWNLHDYADNKPGLDKIEFQNVPRLRKTERELFDSCYKTEHLVESSSTGETFLVMWYRSAADGTNEETRRVEMVTKGFLVFKLMEIGATLYAYYTKNTGDLCIFLSKSEPFCVSASSFPGLDKNSIYYVDVRECIHQLELGAFSISKAEIREDISHLIVSKVPYYFPPQVMQ